MLDDMKRTAKKRKGARVQLACWLDADVKARLDRIKDRDGVTVTAQVRLALEQWVKAHGLELAR